jgi:L-alanine-DL-glutamate epimerase-like enolase superfamily enzyme
MDEKRAAVPMRPPASASGEDRMGPAPTIDRVRVDTFTIPTDSPESDGTIEWNSTTMVLVEVSAGGKTGLGYTYSHAAASELIESNLAKCLYGKDAFDIPALWSEMVRDVRNIGQHGLAACAISALDNSLWDLKARLLELPLVKLLGAAHESVIAYGSGGFTSYSIEQLQKQLGGWAAQGLQRVKMKVGRDAKADPERVRAARNAIGDSVQLYVDANGGYTRKQALEMAEVFAEQNVTWFEEPVVAQDLEGLRLMRDRAPAGMAIAAGEYGYDAVYFRRMVEAGAVDILQADATRCLGISGFLQAAAICEAHCLPLSAHTAPTIHAHACCAVAPAYDVEYFHDHARIEQMLFDGAAVPKHGRLFPNLDRPGFGIELKRKDAERFAA